MRTAVSILAYPLIAAAIIVAGIVLSVALGPVYAWVICKAVAKSKQ